MITSKVLDGFTIMDGCFKYSDPDSTIDCYVLSRNKIDKSLNDIDWELKTNGIYILVGVQDNKTMAYIGQAVYGKDNSSIVRRLSQHLNAINESYNPYWMQAIVFVCKNKDVNLMWDTAVVDDLEALLINDVQRKFSWNSKEESLKNPISIEKARSHSKKLLSIKDYIKELNYDFFDEIDTIKECNTDEEKQEALVKQILDRTVDLTTINLDSNATIPEYTTPEKTANSMLDTLPWDSFGYNTKFIDPACKGGELLALIHDRLMKILEKDEHFSMFQGQERLIRIHDHIINNMIFGIAIGDNSYIKAKQRVYECHNIIKFDKEYIKILKLDSNGMAEKIKEIFLGDKTMKFDTVISNPPYNDTDSTGSSKSISSLFVDLATKITNRYILFIMPDRWFVSPDKLNRECRKALIGKIKYMRDYDDNKEVFSGVSIAGGVSYWLYDKQYDGEMLYEDNFGSINVKHNERFMCKSTPSNILYNHVKNTNSEFMDADYIATSFFGLKREYRGNVIKTDECNIKLVSSGEESYLSIDDIPQNKEYIGWYKVVVPYSSMNPKPFILKPNEICTLTYLIVRLFNNKDEAVNCKKYLETNFFKTLFKGLKTKLGSTKENFMCIPLQDFTSTSDIDWSQSLQNIDQQLYKKYNLSDEEINYIEKTIKPMDESSQTSKLKLTAEDVKAAYINQLINNQ